METREMREKKGNRDRKEIEVLKRKKKKFTDIRKSTEEVQKQRAEGKSEIKINNEGEREKTTFLN